MEFQLSRITGKQGMVKAHVMVWVVREWLTEWLILERSSSRFHGSFLLGLKSEHCRLKKMLSSSLHLVKFVKAEKNEILEVMLKPIPESVRVHTVAAN